MHFITTRLVTRLKVYDAGGGGGEEQLDGHQLLGVQERGPRRPQPPPRDEPRCPRAPRPRRRISRCAPVRSVAAAAPVHSACPLPSLCLLYTCPSAASRRASLPALDMPGTVFCSLLSVSPSPPPRPFARTRPLARPRTDALAHPRSRAQERRRDGRGGSHRGRMRAGSGPRTRWAPAGSWRRSGGSSRCGRRARPG